MLAWSGCSSGRVRRFFVLFFLMAGFLFPVLSHAATPTPTNSTCESGTTTPTDPISTLAVKLSEESSCWSCKLYGTVYTGMHSLVAASYQTLIDPSTGGVILVVTILGTVLVGRFLPFFIQGSGEFELVAGLRMFAFRIVIVFSLVLLVPASNALGAGGLISDFFVDGPLALGTAVAEILSTSTVSAFAQGANVNLGDMTSLFGTPATIGSSGTDMSSFATAHITAASTMLYHLHLLGAVGIIVSAWMLLLYNYSGGDMLSGSGFVVFSCGFYLLMVFFKFTVVFGLKYIDALIRSMLIFALFPVFAVLWIFDSTRPIAVQAIKSGLALSCVFAVSGVVYTLSYFILYFGYSNAFGSGGFGNISGLTNALCGIPIADVNAIVTNQSGWISDSQTMNWGSYFYLIGAGTMATACAELPFQLASEICAFSPGGGDLAGSVASEVGGAMSNMINRVRGR